VILAIASPSFCKNESLCREALSLGLTVRFRGIGPVLAGTELVSFLNGADYAIIGTEVIDSQILAQCPGLKGIAKYGVGLDSIDFSACEEYGVEVCYTEGVNKTSVAELTLGFLLSLAHRAHITSNLLKMGQWQKNGGRQLSSATVGLIGFGHVGQEVARMLMPLGSRVLIRDIKNRDLEARALNAHPVSLSELVKESDFISLHVPLTKDTYHMIGSETLCQMKAGVSIVNTARGNVINFDALKEYLDREIVAGVALDVYPDEPCQDFDFLKRPEVFCTPHIAGNAREAVWAMGMASLSHIQNWIGTSQ